ncbi:SlyX family protein [Pseudomonas oryzihabitans]|uniref:SlyX family protein n=1 Tax=Pseudomonas oryzihabitans TaxID=47885 RepID=UPI0005A8847F|nr:SlyX family protein [Pseudomonas oryzihabitans]NMZ45892.1 SlyX family protein [Pseudomonas oryzihabitans]
MTLEDRIADLEMRQAFQDDTIQTLNDIIVEQQRALDRYAAQIRVLAERQAELQSSGGGGLPDEAPPPHY